jgi:hypothetical protein
MKPHTTHHERCECRVPISVEELPKEAWDQISARQHTYIDEFSFYKVENKIQCWYAGEHLATWENNSWLPYISSVMYV